MLPKMVILILYLIDLISYIVLAILYRLGLNPSFEDDLAPWEIEELLFSGEHTLPMVTTTSMKHGLSVVECLSYVNGRVPKKCSDDDNGPLVCVVCLQLLEARDQVRELKNCKHVFHVACIDQWIDVGQDNCPLCRAKLLPPSNVRLCGWGCLRPLKLLMTMNVFLHITC
ncbi:hypothetical protein HPP92_022712 [Vanilla planifolia]|uniref:RING-type domain-containing protein n=1 Tax=Vanilla planifolia TaxID=51239 RepID=A0A835UDW2_VANPL|nr:hypothetical protein HPP92_022712 [Vanilla planifolia]